MENKFKILLATDYSESVMNAERYAVQMAESINAKLYILHVYQIPVTSTPYESKVYAETRSDVQKSQLWSLEQHRDKLFRTLNVSEKELDCECIVKEGKVGKEIRETASSYEADFVIVGTHGASGFKDLILGSHTWDLIKKATIPVLAIPKDALFTGIKNIVFATNYREGEISPIYFLVQLSKKFDAAVTILHVSDFEISKDTENSLIDKFKNEIKDKIPEINIDLRVAHYYDIVNGLNDFCVRAKADLLVLSPEKPWLLENLFSPVTSVTRKMTFNTLIPLLSIPDYYNTENSKLWDIFYLDENYLNENY